MRLRHHRRSDRRGGTRHQWPSTRSRRGIPRPTRFGDHWWWRPGWRIGRRFYTWHLTFDRQDELHALVAAYQAELAELPGLDLIPHEWLHLTMQGVGFTDEVSDEDISAIANAARHRLAQLPPARFTFHRAVVRPEAIALPPRPADAVRTIRSTVREAIADVWGADRVPEQAEGFQPHVSMAYINTPGLAAPIVATLDRVTVAPVSVTVAEASLIALGRDSRVYQWTDPGHRAIQLAAELTRTRSSAPASRREPGRALGRSRGRAALTRRSRAAAETRPGAEASGGSSRVRSSRC